MVSNFDQVGVVCRLVSRSRVAELVERFMLGWRDITERGVEALVVEPADVANDRELELRLCSPDAIGDQLGLEAVDEAFGHRVVVGVADRSDRREHVMVIKDLRVVKRRVLLGLNRSSQRCCVVLSEKTVYQY